LEFYFVAEAVGKVWITFEYNGSYWEDSPTSDKMRLSRGEAFLLSDSKLWRRGFPIFLFHLYWLVLQLSLVQLFCSIRRDSRNPIRISKRWNRDKTALLL
jgi:hypothetical protein